MLSIFWFPTLNPRWLAVALWHPWHGCCQLKPQQSPCWHVCAGFVYFEYVHRSVSADDCVATSSSGEGKCCSQPASQNLLCQTAVAQVVQIHGIDMLLLLFTQAASLLQHVG